MNGRRGEGEERERVMKHVRMNGRREGSTMGISILLEKCNPRRFPGARCGCCCCLRFTKRQSVSISAARRLSRQCGLHARPQTAETLLETKINTLLACFVCAVIYLFQKGCQYEKNPQYCLQTMPKYGHCMDMHNGHTG